MLKFHFFLIFSQVECQWLNKEFTLALIPGLQFKRLQKILKNPDQKTTGHQYLIKQIKYSIGIFRGISEVI